MLLGRPWIHAVQAITSTLHQKIKLPLDGKIITIEASNFRANIQKRAPEKKAAEVIIEPENDICGFDFFVDMIEKDPNFGMFANNVVHNLMIQQGYVWGGPLNPARAREMPQFKTENNPWSLTMGLGYKPKENDIEAMIKERNQRKKTANVILRPYSHNLMNYFIKVEVIDPLNTLCEHLKTLEISGDCFSNDKEEFDIKGASPTKGSYAEESLINMAMRDGKFDPNSLITDAESKTVTGWRKTIKWSDAKGRILKLTTGEGTMFEGSDEETEDETEDEDKEEKLESNNKIESSVTLDVVSGEGSSND